MSDEPAREQSAPSVTPHAQPFVCPYCGEDQLRPDDEPETWYCPSCTRAFHLELRAIRR